MSSYKVVEEFLAADLPEKAPLIEGLLYRRDMVAFGGRRREGKTTFATNMAVALATGRADFIGYPVAKACRVLFIYLEDDEAEVQETLKKVLDGVSGPEGRLAIITRPIFEDQEILIRIDDMRFRTLIEDACEKFKPDVVVIDNMIYLVGGDCNNHELVMKVGLFAKKLGNQYDCAVVIPAHLRKKSNNPNWQFDVVKEPADAFEDIMGSSVFINTFGSIWYIERRGVKTVFAGGSQRYLGHTDVSHLTLEDDKWFRVTDNLNEALSGALNSPEKKAAWKLFPPPGEIFNKADLLGRVIDAKLMPKSTLYYWWGHSLIRTGLITEGDEGWTRRI